MKCSTWEDTAPVLKRYFQTLRKRLQLPVPKPYASHEEACAAKPIDTLPDGSSPSNEQIDAALYSDWEVLERLAVTPQSDLFGLTLTVAQRAEAIARLPAGEALPEVAAGPGDDGLESEPDDVNPLRGEDEGDEDGLDSEDDEVDGDELLQPFELPAGFQVASAPTAAQLDYGDLAARKTLGDRLILYRWAGVGWCVGELTPNTDGRRKVNGQVKNF